jgi:hypothetical protein
MDRTITDLFHSLLDRGLPARQSSELMPFAQSDTFFRMAVHKSNRVRALRDHFKAHGVRRVFVTSRMHGADLSHLGIEVYRLDIGWFQDSNEDSRAAKRALIDDAVVIGNNNDVDGTGGESYFDQGGCDGIARRHRLAMTEHHGERRLHQILMRLADQLEPPVGRGVAA